MVSHALGKHRTRRPPQALRSQPRRNPEPPRGVSKSPHSPPSPGAQQQLPLGRQHRAPSPSPAPPPPGRTARAASTRPERSTGAENCAGLAIRRS
eukprot:6541210-Heterocapsa_arctica.AAC.1